MSKHLDEEGKYIYTPIIILALMWGTKVLNFNIKVF